MISAYSTVHRYSTSSIALKILDYHSLERELAAGVLLIAAGILAGVYIIQSWIASGYGSLSQIALAVASLVLISSGLQLVYTAFFLSMLLLER
jgi:hypothetical protein